MGRFPSLHIGYEDGAKCQKFSVFLKVPKAPSVQTCGWNTGGITHFATWVLWTILLVRVHKKSVPHGTLFL